MDQRLFPQFPKIRPPLPPGHQAIYLEHYRVNRSGASPVTKWSARLERWMHRKVAADVRGEINTALDTLEIGAGNLNHLSHEHPVKYDIIEPFRDMYINSSSLPRVRQVFDDIGNIPREQLYDRIISIATLEHLTDLPRVIAFAVLHLKPRGSLRVAIPSEGAVPWRLAVTLSTGIEFYLKYRLRYSTLMQYEHVNNWKEIRLVLGSFFSRISDSCFGFSPRLSLYQFYHCQSPRIDVSKQYLSSIGEL